MPGVMVACRLSVLSRFCVCAAGLSCTGPVDGGTAPVPAEDVRLLRQSGVDAPRPTKLPSKMTATVADASQSSA